MQCMHPNPLHIMNARDLNRAKEAAETDNHVTPIKRGMVSPKKQKQQKQKQKQKQVQTLTCATLKN